MKVLALDFDGVISDSAPECFWIALRTVVKVFPNPSYAALLADLEGRSREIARESVIQHPTFQKFVEVMPLGNRAEDFGVSLLAIEAGEDLPDQYAYDEFRKLLAPDFAAAFQRDFYTERDAFRGAQPLIWASLMDPYAELLEILRRRQGDAGFAIATAKDGKSVARLLCDYQIADLFPSGSVFDKESGRDKRAHLRAIRERFGVEFGEITFVDDKANHLLLAKELGVRCLLAGWGYNGAREYEVAHRAGIEVASLGGFEAMAFG